jgi:hypothetical protein
MPLAADPADVELGRWGVAGVAIRSEELEPGRYEGAKRPRAWLEIVSFGYLLGRL